MIIKLNFTSANKKSLDYLISFIIGSVFFINLLHLPYFDLKVQLTEIFFIFSIPFIPYKIVFDYSFNQHKKLFILIAAYALFDLISAIASKEIASIFESLGRIYLFSLLFLLIYYFNEFTEQKLIDFITRIFIFCSILIFLMCAEGYLQLALGHYSRFLYFNFNYPYFGNIYRLKGATEFPVMMISMLNFLFFYFVGVYNKSSISKKWLQLILTMLAICLAFTLSKSLVLTVLGVLIVCLRKLNLLNKFSFCLLTIALGLFAILGTHLIVAKKGTTDLADLKKTIYTSDVIVFETDNYYVLESDYLTVKKASLKIFAEHPLLGVGTGNINKEIFKYKQRGLFPKKLNNLDPHSTYLGALVENGIFAAVLLIAIFIFLLSMFLKRKDLIEDNFLLALFIIYITFFIDGIYTDILNFRHLWVFLAIAITYLYKKNLPITA